MEWFDFKQEKGQIIQVCITKFKERATLLGVSLNIDEILLKYIGGLHSYLYHTILLFKPTNLDDVYVQAQYLEECGRFDNEDNYSKSKPHRNDKFAASYAKEENKKKRGHYSHCDKYGHTKDGCWRLHLDRTPRWFDQGKEIKNAMVSKDPVQLYEIEDSSIIDENLSYVLFKIPCIMNAKRVVVHKKKELQCISRKGN